MSVVYIIETNFAGNGNQVMQFARGRGYEIHFLTSNPDDYIGRLNPLPTEIADDYTVVNCYDFDELSLFFDERMSNIAAILTFDDFHLDVCAQLCERYGLNTPSHKSVLRIRDKEMVRQMTNATTSKIEVSSFTLDRAPQTSPVKYPVVVKPADESGSVGVHVCGTDKDWQAAIKKLSGLPENVRSYQRSGKVVVEQYIDGMEYSAELIWCNDIEDWQLIGITKKYLTEGNSRVEVGHTFPCTEEMVPVALVEAKIRSWLNTVGLASCVAHVEFKINSSGIHLIEINARVAGGNIAELVQLSCGVDLVECSLNIALGEQESILIPQNGTFSAIRFLIPERSGEILSVDMSTGRHSPFKVSVRDKFPISFNGELSASHRLGYCISLGESFDEAEEVANSVIQYSEVQYL